MEEVDLRFDFSKTALIVLDLQPSVVRKPSVPNDPVLVVAKAATLVKEFRDAGATIIFVTYSPDENATRPVTDTPRNAAVIGQAKELPVPELGMSQTDIRIKKRGYDAFFKTGLEEILSSRGINTLVLCGISTESGVESTARRGMEHGYTQVIALDVISGKSMEEHYGAMSFFRKWCLLRTTDQIHLAVRNSPKSPATRKKLTS